MRIFCKKSSYSLKCNKVRRADNSIKVTKFMRQNIVNQQKYITFVISL